MAMAEKAQRRKEIEEMFKLFDTAGRGAINADDLPLVLRSLGMSEDYLDAEVVESMRRAIDPKGTHELQLEPFIEIVGPSMVEPGSFEEQWRVFRMFDREKKGYVDLDDLVHVGNIECAGMLSEKQCAFILTQLKTSRRPGLTFDEWKRAVGNVMATETTGW